MKKFGRLLAFASILILSIFFTPSYGHANPKMPYIMWMYPKRINELWRFFGRHTGKFINSLLYLADLTAHGLEIDTVGDGAPIRILPYLGNDHYLDTGFSSAGYGPHVAAAVIMNYKGNIFSSALLFSNGLSIFVRNKNELPLARKAFNDWANGIWQHAVWEPQTGPNFPTKIYILKGYGNESVN